MTDILPPHEPKAELGVLGSILIDPQASIGKCVELMTAAGEEFYNLANREIYQVCLGLYGAGIPADMVTVYSRLREVGKLEQVGGISYIQSLPNETVSSANIEHYIAIIREKFLLRSIIQTCTDVVSKAYEFHGDADSLMDQVESSILKIRPQRTKGDISIKQLVRDALDEIEDDHQRQGKISGLSTGLVDLDELTNGLQNSEMIVIAARPSMGKTSLAMNIVEHVAIELKLPVAVFSLEMSGKSLAKRLLCSRARVNVRRARKGLLIERDIPKLATHSIRIANAPIFIVDTGGMSVMSLRAKLRRWHQEHGIKLAVIDYLQLLNAIGGPRRFESRQQEITEISASIKTLAKELDIPIIVLSQLNRELEREKFRKPRLSDLRESGAIEQDADVIGFLYKRPSKDPNADEDNDNSVMSVNLLIAKQRNGPAGEDVYLTFFKEFTRFESAAAVTQEENYSLPYRD